MESIRQDCLLPVDLRTWEGTLPRTEGIANLSPREAWDLLTAGVVLVDLREAYETNYRVFDVERVVYLPWSSFEGRIGELPRDEALILADASGIYGRVAARLLVRAGFTNLGKLSGGMIDWDAAGLPVRKDLNFELGGQCACKIKNRVGRNPLKDKRPS